jgi:hypothetical protein
MARSGLISSKAPAADANRTGSRICPLQYSGEAQVEGATRWPVRVEMTGKRASHNRTVLTNRWNSSAAGSIIGE